MPIQKTHWTALEAYLPVGAIHFVNELFHPYRIKLILSLPRHTILGYYKRPSRTSPEHTITINKDLNPYAFFFVLLHEMAHLQTFVRYALSVKPHGNEWKRCFGELLAEACARGYFPKELTELLQTSIRHPSSLKSCTDARLMRELKKWNTSDTPEEWVAVETIPLGERFVDRKGRQMQLIQKRRTRYLCKALNTLEERSYLYPPLMEVKRLP